MNRTVITGRLFFLEWTDIKALMRIGQKFLALTTEFNVMVMMPCAIDPQHRLYGLLLTPDPGTCLAHNDCRNI